MPLKLPPQLIPILETVRTNIPARDVPLDFWQIDSGPKILNAMMELSSHLMQSSLAEEEIPHGYVVLAYLFDWERHCQFDGWGAFRNIHPDDFVRVCQYFEQVGLEAESTSLAHQMHVYQQAPNNHEALVQATEQYAHSLSGDLDRLEYLTQYFCDNADTLLYVQA